MAPTFALKMGSHSGFTKLQNNVISLIASDTSASKKIRYIHVFGKAKRCIHLLLTKLRENECTRIFTTLNELSFKTIYFSYTHKIQTTVKEAPYDRSFRKKHFKILTINLQFLRLRSLAPTSLICGLT